MFPSLVTTRTVKYYPNRQRGRVAHTPSLALGVRVMFTKKKGPGCGRAAGPS